MSEYRPITSEAAFIPPGGSIADRVWDPYPMYVLKTAIGSIGGGGVASDSGIAALVSQSDSATRQALNSIFSTSTPNWDNITNKPTTFAPKLGTTSDTALAGNYVPDYKDLTSKPDLKTVATTGKYGDLTERPDLKTVATTGKYTDLTDRPDLKAVATSGNFSDMQGTLTSAQLPALSFQHTYVIASASAQLALSAVRGDIAIRTDVSKTYVLSTDSPSVSADWKELLNSGSVTSVAGKTGSITLLTSDLSDAASGGINVLKTPTYAGIRTLIGAGTSNLAIGTIAGTAKEGNYAPSAADIPAGSTLTVAKSGTVWPARPTARADVIVQWVGASPPPPIVESGTGGMRNNIDFYIYPQTM